MLDEPQVRGCVTRFSRPTGLEHLTGIGGDQELRVIVDHVSKISTSVPLISFQWVMSARQRSFG
jgi:hypothetical protein